MEASADWRGEDVTDPSPGVGLDAVLLDVAFPFHLVLDQQLRIRQAGSSLRRLCGDLELGEHLTDRFEVELPKGAATFAGLRRRRRSLVLLRAPRGITLRGQVLDAEAGTALIFICSPWVTDAAALTDAGLTLNDFAVSDATIDYMLLLQQQAASLSQAHELAARLQSSEQRVRQIIETANDAFVELTADGRVLAWNKRAEQIFGWSAEEMVGELLADRVLPAQLQEPHRQRLQDTVAGAPSSHHVSRTANIDAVRKDGGVVPVEVAMWATPHEGQITVNLTARDNSERVAAERRTAEQAATLAHQALHDPLTGLGNRSLLHERLRHALAREGSSPAVLLLDLDDFKTVNDVLGHAAGDQLLVDVARRLTRSVRAADTVARLGGDEFAILVDDSDPTTLAARVLEELSEPIELGGRSLVPLGSIGIAPHTTGVDVEQLLVQADVAMYAAKSAGKGRVEHYSHQMTEAIRRRADLREALVEAVSRSEIVVHYQPIVDVAAKGVSRVEALVRWRRGQELVPPMQFLEIAEQTGLIVDIGYEVLRRSCADLSGWLAQDHRRSLAVNMSALQLAEADLVDRVMLALASTGVRPGQLVLEITETLFLETTQELLDSLCRLREHGIRIAIDDFGTGYSSLGRLHALPIDSIKIDKSFVDLLITGEEDLPIITSTILMAHALGLDVTAEGVETAEQAERLTTWGCDYLQGFHFARPEPPPAATSAAADRANAAWLALMSRDVVSATVLVIEDDAVSRTIVRMALTDRGFDVESAETGSEGLALAAELDCDCVLVDLGLPDMNGLDVVRALRSSPGMDATAIIVVTGAASRDVKGDAFRAGADDYLVKPIETEHLAARLNGAVRAARQAAPAPRHPPA